ncbi:MAG TPA: MFS transporter, partial [Azonexus sp.]|nr:MFS transporter [Azonexus sp.]
AGIGFCTGIAGPSRDLLVRRAATARFGQAAFGRVYGFVYSGLDLGLASAPLIFGGLMDGRQFSQVLVGVAVLQTLAILAALRVGKTA